MQVGKMKWDEMSTLVCRQLDKLAMCKRGTVATDIHKMKEKLGPMPRYTMEERADVKKKLTSKIQKAWAPTVKQVRSMNSHDLARRLRDKATKVEENAYVHPKYAAWKKAIERLNTMEDERLATLEGDFQDAKDNFQLSIVPLEEFPRVRQELEAQEW